MLREVCVDRVSAEDELDREIGRTLQRLKNLTTKGVAYDYDALWLEEAGEAKPATAAIDAQHGTNPNLIVTRFCADGPRRRVEAHARRGTGRDTCFRDLKPLGLAIRAAPELEPLETRMGRKRAYGGVGLGGVTLHGNRPQKPAGHTRSARPASITTPAERAESEGRSCHGSAENTVYSED